ncbi:hypothetical protein STEG23_006076 [Scotinomys teguina]
MTEITGIHASLAKFACDCESNTRLHACQASTLPTKLHPYLADGSIYTLLLKMSSSGSSEEDSTTISSQEYSTELRSESSLREAETFHSQYVVSKTIGHGAYGKVKLAQHHLTGTPMAVNVLQKKKLWDHPVSSEVDIMMMINHSNIILLVQVIESEKSTYLIMVLAKGHELYDYVQEAGHLEDLQANPKCRGQRHKEVSTQEARIAARNQFKASHKCFRNRATCLVDTMDFQGNRQYWTDIVPSIRRKMSDSMGKGCKERKFLSVVQSLGLQQLIK